MTSLAKEKLSNLKNDNNNFYDVIAYDGYLDVYLLENKNIEALTAYVVASEVVMQNGIIGWRQGAYFTSLNFAREYYYEKILIRLENHQKSDIFESIYDDVDHFTKFKCICSEERNYSHFNESDWNEFYDIYMENDNISGFIDNDILNDLEDNFFDRKGDD